MFAVSFEASQKLLVFLIAQMSGLLLHDVKDFEVQVLLDISSTFQVLEALGRSRTQSIFDVLPLLLVIRLCDLVVGLCMPLFM